MRVQQVAGDTPVETNHVYGSPPNRYVSVRQGVLCLTPPGKRQPVRMPIDFLFRTLAEDQQERAVSIIPARGGTVLLRYAQHSNVAVARPAPAVETAGDDLTGILLASRGLAPSGRASLRPRESQQSRQPDPADAPQALHAGQRGDHPPVRDPLFSEPRDRDLTQSPGPPTQVLLARVREGLQTRLRGLVHRRPRTVSERT